MVSLTKNFNEKRPHLNSYKKSPDHFEQFEFNMSIVIGSFGHLCLVSTNTYV
jgi:hypothetical protein